MHTGCWGCTTTWWSVRGTGEVGVHFRVEKLGNSSADHRFRIVSRNTTILYAEGRRIVVKLDPVTMRPARWTDPGRAHAAAPLRAAE